MMRMVLGITAGLAAFFAAPAAAALITLDFHLRASGFGSGAPTNPVTGRFVATLDPVASFGATRTGLTVTGLNRPGTPFMAYDATQDMLTIGTEVDIGGFGITPGQIGWGLSILDASTSAYRGGAFIYTNTTRAFIANTVRLTAVPEPASWALMIAGFGAIGGAMRRGRGTVRYAGLRWATE